ncbi:hypothetical protein BN1708_019762, partial [Verticillium longisporum]
LWHGHA